MALLFVRLNQGRITWLNVDAIDLISEDDQGETNISLRGNLSLHSDESPEAFMDRIKSAAQR